MTSQSSRPSFALRAALRSAQTLVLIWLVSRIAGPVQAQSDRDLHAYTDAIGQLQSTGNLAPLEHYVATAPDGFLRTDGLEWLAWREWRSGTLAKASHWCDELLAGNPQNAVGLAVLASRSPVSTASPQQAWADDPLLVAQRALRYLDSLRQPHAMPDATFQNMKQDLAANLSGTVGDGYFQRQDYATAQPYLRQYLTLAPEDSRRIYSLAIADLYSPNPNEGEGFRLLARAVNLTQGTVAGQQMASFARNKYLERGGSDQDWDRYLQSTTARGSVQLAASSPAPPPSSSAPAPKNNTSAGGSGTAPASATPGPVIANRNPSARAIPAPAPPAPVTRAATNNVPDYDVPSTSTGDMNVPYPTRIPTATGAPMSLGILIETSKTAWESRRAVINNLSDMIRHLRDDDEAFLVSFSDNVVFEEDLTSDPRSIEKAMDKIKPQRGAALLDAVTFASGHLQRIAKNSRKILLVISDGEDRSAQYSSAEALTSISSSGVEIYCIGMGSPGAIDQARLRALARRTGGQAVFIDGSREFRTATREVASDMGIRLY